MIKCENECVDCGLPCFDGCEYKEVIRYYCDECSEEFSPDELYLCDYEDDEVLCKDCLLGKFKKIKYLIEY